jgi:hypothetical protein
MARVLGHQNVVSNDLSSHSIRRANFLLGVTSQSFDFTGAAQAFTVPTDVTQITVELYGASGGDQLYSTSTFGFGGAGGMISATITVTPDEVLNVYIGAVGVVGAVSSYNGGGKGSTGIGTSGGGASDIRRAPYALANRLVVAGGGGGCYSYLQSSRNCGSHCCLPVRR